MKKEENRVRPHRFDLTLNEDERKQLEFLAARRGESKCEVLRFLIRKEFFKDTFAKKA